LMMFWKQPLCVKNDDCEVWISGDFVRLKQEINFHIP